MIRGKAKYKPDYKLKDVYDYYVKETYMKHFKSAFMDSADFVLPYSIYKKLLSDYFKKIINFVVEDCGVFKLPLGFGELRVQKKKMPVGSLLKYRKLRIDFAKFNKTGKKIYHLNEHRDGYRYSIRWDKRGSTALIYKNVYKFIPTRTTNRRLAYILKNDFTKDYFE